MDAAQLLREWPTWSHANAEKILASPAWRMPVVFNGAESVMTATAEDPEEILLAVKFEDEPHVLGLRDSEVYPDLHLLWSRRAELDRNLLLALIEKECGPLFQMLEDAVRREFSVVGLAEGVADSAPRKSFAVPELGFSLDLSPSLQMLFGKLEYLDVTHESIRSETRPARYRYASVEVSASDLAAIGEGDAVVLPDGADGSWITGLPDDGMTHVCADADVPISFGAFADDELPEPSGEGPVVLVNGGRSVAEGEFSTIGDVRCFRLTRLRS